MGGPFIIFGVFLPQAATARTCPPAPP